APKAPSPAATRDAPVDDQMSLIELLELELEFSTATRMVKQSALRAPSIVHVIAREQIDRYGYRSVQEALSYAPGLFVVDDLVTGNLGVRGIYAGPDSWSRTFKFMINGNPVQYQSTGGALFGPEFVPIDAVERIEVVRGPASAVYGANAFLGVINVITRAPDSQLGALVSGELGAIRDNPSVGLGLSIWGRTPGAGRLWGMAAAQLQRLDRSGLAVPDTSPRSDAFTGQRSQGDTALPASALARIGFDGGTFGNLVLQMVYQQLDARAAFHNGVALQEDNRLAKDNLATRLDYRLGLLGEHAAPHALDVHAWAGVIAGRALDRERFVTPQGQLHRDRANLTLEGGVEVAYVHEDASLVVGSDYQATHDDGSSLYSISNSGARTLRTRRSELSFRNHGAFAQLVLRPLAAWSVTGGVRFDHNTRWGDQWTYRAASVVEATRWLSVKLLHGTSFVPPAPSELDAVPLRMDGGIVGNPDLNSQRARTYELAALLRPLNVLRLDLTAFLTDVTDRVETVPVGLLFEPRNQTKSQTVGVELDASLRAGDLTLQADLALQRTVLQEPELPGYRWEVAYVSDAPLGGYPPNFPAVIAHQKLAYALRPWSLEIALLGTTVGSRKATVDNIVENGSSYRLPAQQLLGVHVRTLDWVWLTDRETVLSLHGENLLNSRYAHGGTGGIDLPTPGRVLFLRVSQEL
ncbi:MAG: TonB-dependent receptor, partial [Myxococcales bacterium]|nr:TonB-dependent receptor [Myxococcales bacterium]